jgi:uncharacterized damage-inducible protein DinB
MAARADQLAGKFDKSCQDFTSVIDKLSDADWKKQTASEKWSVAAVAHHVAGSCGAIAGLVQLIAKGQPMPNLTMQAIHDNNAKHAQEFANASKADTLSLFKTNAANAAGIVRGLSDAELDRSASLLGGQPMTTAQVIDNILIHHIEEHLGSIRAAASAK